MAASAIGIAAPSKRDESSPFAPLDPRPRVNLSGALIDQVDLLGAVERIKSFLNTGSVHQVMTVNLDFLSIAQRNPIFRQTLNRADLAVADGMPLVWASRLKGKPLPERVTGVDLVDCSCDFAARNGHSVYLLGGRRGVADTAGTRLRERHPDLRIPGAYSPS